MLFAVGMYLPFATTFAIFVGGITKWVTDTIRRRRGLNEAQAIRVENVGILVASGLIAGEALIGLAIATFRFFDKPLPAVFDEPSFLAGMAVLLFVLAVMVIVPLRNPGRPEDPPPPTAIM
jgi:hypothetical protein